MNSDDTQHLADLAKIELTDTEREGYTNDLKDILPLIEKIKEAASDDDNGRIESAGVRNVLRNDDDVIPAGTYTDVITSEMPETENGYNKVKKIL